MVIFPRRVLVELGLAYDNHSGIQVISKTKKQKNKGTVIKGYKKTSKGDKVVFFTTEGQIFDDGKALINEKDIALILKPNRVKVLGTRILIEPQKEESELSDKIVKSEAHRSFIPIGTVLKLGDEVNKVSEGDMVIFNEERRFDLTPYNIEKYKGKTIYIVRQEDIMAII